MITSHLYQRAKEKRLSALDRYHVLVHSVSYAIGYDYHNAKPDWVHPFIHFILVLAPAVLVSVGTYIIWSGVLNFWRHQRVVSLPPDLIRGLDICLFGSVLRYSKKQQVLMILLSRIALPVLYLTLELPKQIVDNVLESERFPVDFLGRDVDQVTFLMLLSGLYLLAIMLIENNKYVLNVFKLYAIERFLCRFRLFVYRQWRYDPVARDKIEIVPFFLLRRLNPSTALLLMC